MVDDAELDRITRGLRLDTVLVFDRGRRLQVERRGGLDVVLEVDGGEPQPIGWLGSQSAIADEVDGNDTALFHRGDHVPRLLGDPLSCRVRK